MKKFYILLAILFVYSSFSFSSEFILQVKKLNQVVVTVQSQTQFNNTNYFQFYQLSGGQIHVNVKEKWTGTTLFNNYVNIPNNVQMYAELDNMGNLTILSSNPMTNNGTVGSVNYGNTGYYGNSGYNNGSWNNNGYNHNNHCGSTGNNSYNNNNNVTYNQFLNSLRNESFDSNRLKDASNYASKTNLSAQQIAEIAGTFTFDSYRLDFAKNAYNTCYDKNNYFLLKNTFTFTSYYNDLIEYTN